MGTLVFNKEHASPPEQAIVYKEGKRIGAVRLTEKNELIFRVDPDAPSRSVSKVPDDPTVELTAKELERIAHELIPFA
jgi:hypothetical protein